MRKLVFSICSAVLILSTTQSGLSDAIVIGFEPASQSVAKGSSADVALQISGLGALAALSLGTFDLVVNFDPAILGFSSAVYGDSKLGDQLNVDGLGTVTTATPGVGNVDVFELSLNSSADLNAKQASSFTMATLTFNTVGSGTSPLTITVNALGDADGNSLSAALESGSLTVTPSGIVPEPSTLLLLVTALGGLGILILWRSRQEATGA